jgi:hypothetical protein
MMRRTLTAVILLATLGLSSGLRAQDKKPPTTLRGVLLEQLRNTHNKVADFVPVNTAVEGLTAEQAKWTPGNGQHSVGQLAYHIWFWDSDSLAEFKGEKRPVFSGNNDDTFNNFNPAQWNDLVAKLNQVLTDLETAVEQADDQKLAAKASLIARVSAHNAYHIGQIVNVRKLENAWDSSKGVK